MTSLHWAAVVLASLAYLSFGVFIGCLLNVDRSGLGGLAAGFSLICGVGAVMFWWLV